MVTPQQWEALDFAERARRWEYLTPVEKDRVRSKAGLTPQLVGLEGCRVEVMSIMTGEKHRFWVGRSSGWQPCHIALKLRTSRGGLSCDREYKAVRVVRQKRGSLS
jgi:hypothetical protein